MSTTNHYSMINIGSMAALAEQPCHGKYFVGQELALTGSEISINCLPAGQSTPFVHAHRQNEEVYIFIGGSGLFFAGGHEFPVSEGSIVRVSPQAARAVKAGSADLLFICVQAKSGSLEQATMQDGFLTTDSPSWSKD